jgi:hypothetical protein
MADIADIANDQIEREIAATLKYRPAAEIPKGTGECLYCGERLPFAQRWCDAECRDDWEKEQKKQPTVGE